MLLAVIRRGLHLQFAQHGHDLVPQASDLRRIVHLPPRRLNFPEVTGHRSLLLQILEPEKAGPVDELAVDDDLVLSDRDLAFAMGWKRQLPLIDPAGSVEVPCQERDKEVMGL